MLRQRQNISVKYFVEFLSEISVIIRNIRNYVHQIIEISAPKAKTEIMKQSMSDVIACTSKTFGDLKAIESLIAGYAKAHRIKIEKRSLSESHSTNFQSYQNSKKSSFARIWYKNGLFQKEVSPKRRVNIMSRNQNRQTKVSEKTKDYILEEVEKSVFDDTKNLQLSQEQHKVDQQQNWLSKVQSMLRNIIQSNRKSLQKIVNQNQSCRNDVLNLKAQLMQNC